MQPHVRQCSLDAPDSASQTTFRSVQPFLHSSWHRVPTLYNGPPLFLLKIAPLHGGSESHLIMVLCVRPTQYPKRHIDQPFSAELTTMTDRLTDHTTPPVIIGCIYVVLQCALKTKGCFHDHRHTIGPFQQFKENTHTDWSPDLVELAGIVSSII